MESVRDTKGSRFLSQEIELFKYGHIHKDHYFLFFLSGMIIWIYAYIFFYYFFEIYYSHGRLCYYINIQYTVEH